VTDLAIGQHIIGTNDIEVIDFAVDGVELILTDLS
jgi:hypothetical protein